MTRVWHICIDTGGTFTDCLACDPQGLWHRAKVLSSCALRFRVTDHPGPNLIKIAPAWPGGNSFVEGMMMARPGTRHAPIQVVQAWKDRNLLKLRRPWKEDLEDATIEIRFPGEAPLLAAHVVTATAPGDSLPPHHLRLATTRATNALLEGKVTPVALFVASGFGDLLAIGDQTRPDLFALEIPPRRQLYQAVVEVAGRLDATGHELSAIKPDPLREAATALLEAGIRTAAISLPHSLRNPAHEKAVAALLDEIGFERILCSHTLGATSHYLTRTQTTVVEAALSSRISHYMESIRTQGQPQTFQVLDSAAVLHNTEDFCASQSLLSGPAAAVLGATAARPKQRLISFDMGGTSTDVARIDGEAAKRYEVEIAGFVVQQPAIDLHTIAAGGGSICWYDQGRLRVGPMSAGASPGPACYGAGGPLTLTDLNLLLGNLSPTAFHIPVDIEASRLALQEIREIYELSESPEVLANGWLQIANESMAAAVRKISLEGGVDPAEFSMVAFGGAGAVHACHVAEILGMQEVIVPAETGLLSAAGLLEARRGASASRELLAPLDDMPDPAAAVEELKVAAAEQLGLLAQDAQNLIYRSSVFCRFVGQEHCLEIPWEPDLDIRETFLQKYARLYGHVSPLKDIELQQIRVTAQETETLPLLQSPDTGEACSATSDEPWFDSQNNRWQQAQVLPRQDLPTDWTACGPLLIVDSNSSCFVPPDWQALMLEGNCIQLAKTNQSRRTPQHSEQVQAELFANRFRSLVTDMGQQLRRTAVSINIRERLDFSCALLDPDGHMVVNAPHIPVHLGALGLCVRTLYRDRAPVPGETLITNHPAFGGSHLPDVTLVTPAFDENKKLIGYVANRAHHAEIGGRAPGSMPADATLLGEEGIVISPQILEDQDGTRWETLRELLTSGDHPSRAVEDNLADLSAALAANHFGVQRLQSLAREHQSATLHWYMRMLRVLATQALEESLEDMDDGTYQAQEKLDDGSILEVAITICGTRAVFDFAGTSPQHPGNLNATPAIVNSAVMYVLRLLAAQNLPLNEGLLDPVEIRLPQGMLNPDFDSEAPAVVGGNTEISQRLINLMLRALRMQADCQGTMNNVLFGSDDFGYYETIGGGCGAGRGFAGASGVHSHMTNTRITDLEVLERRFPLRIRRFALRRGSGGKGVHAGGEGLIREYQFLQPLSLSLLTGHRETQPAGLEGGRPGGQGRNRLIRATGEEENPGCSATLQVQAGDSLIVETPGGGGWGKPT